ncbi:MAG: hypothetical protein IJR14_04930, partial [Synergistaceae bacterium]|nr:hypothetical protein [Synergistaceae bacterium]
MQQLVMLADEDLEDFLQLKLARGDRRGASSSFQCAVYASSSIGLIDPVVCPLAEAHDTSRCCYRCP